LIDRIIISSEKLKNNFIQFSGI